MIPAPVGYVRVHSLGEAFDALGDPEAKVLAGGHSLIPLMKLRFARPTTLVDIGRLDLGRIGTGTEGEIWVGALATWRSIAEAEVLRGPLLAAAECAAAVGDLQVRNRGTIGGGLCHADPASDMAAAVVALSGSVLVTSPEGERTVPAEGFVEGPFVPGLGARELVARVGFPLPRPGSASAYVAVEDPASGYPLAGAAALATVAEGQIVECRIGITGVASVAYRPRATEAAIEGWRGDGDALRSSVDHVCDGVVVIEDPAADTRYRAAIARVVAARAVERAYARATAGREA